MKPRPPYITESATDYYHNVIKPYFDKAKIGFSSNGDNICTSYTAYHWYREPSDNIAALIFEKRIEAR